MNISLTAAQPFPAHRARTRTDLSRVAARSAAANAARLGFAEATAPIEAVLPSRPKGGSHATGLAIVVLVHVLVGYAIASGLARDVIDSVRAPIEARLIQEVKLPPPPPPPAPVEKIKPVVKVAAPPPPFVPPPEVRVEVPSPAPTITALTREPPPAPAPVVAAAPAALETVSIGVACPTMVSPVMPRRAQSEGIGGLVKARATIRDGKVVDVQILSSTPRGVFDASVRTAMSQYGCKTTGTSEIVALQTFEFRSAQ